MVQAAADDQSNGVGEALADLCQQYWYPLYAFVRRKGFDSSQAEDLTQSFFAELLEKKRLQHAEPARGSFRSFLLTSMGNFVANHWRAESAQKRGGGIKVLSIDYEHADQRYSRQLASDLTAEKIFERNWALSILEQTLAAVGTQYEQSGKREIFELLQGFITGNGNIPYDDLSQQTCMRIGALKVALHRLRQRYGQQLRLQIARTVLDPADVEQELDSLFQALD
jgi:RNA polymerase sigma-70 factor (ECF subfamily)